MAPYSPPPLAFHVSTAAATPLGSPSASRRTPATVSDGSPFCNASRHWSTNDSMENIPPPVTSQSNATSLASSGRTAAPRAGLTVEESVHVDEIDAGKRTERALRGGQRGHHVRALGGRRPRDPFPTRDQFGVGLVVGGTCIHTTKCVRAPE